MNLHQRAACSVQCTNWSLHDAFKIKWFLKVEMRRNKKRCWRRIFFVLVWHLIVNIIEFRHAKRIKLTNMCWPCVWRLGWQKYISFSLCVIFCRFFFWFDEGEWKRKTMNVVNVRDKDSNEWHSLTRKCMQSSSKRIIHFYFSAWKPSRK